MEVKIERTATLRFTTRNPTTGAAQNADSLPSVSVFEEGTDTPILTPTPANYGTGRYKVDVVATAANGFEAAKEYNVEVAATVASVADAAIIAWFIITTRDRDDLAFPTVSGRSVDVTAAGEVGLDLDNTVGALAKGTEITGFNDLDAAGIRGAVGLASANLDTQLAAIAAFIDTEVASILADTDDIQTRLPTTLIGGRMDSSVGAMAADVLTATALATSAVNEIRDAMLAGTLSELSQAAPPASPSVAQALMLLYMAARNLLQVTATEKRITNDAGTVITKKVLSDDGTTYAEAEMVSGP